eukprot:gene565-3882_t
MPIRSSILSLLLLCGVVFLLCTATQSHSLEEPESVMSDMDELKEGLKREDEEQSRQMEYFKRRFNTFMKSSHRILKHVKASEEERKEMMERVAETSKRLREHGEEL